MTATPDVPPVTRDPDAVAGQVADAKATTDLADDDPRVRLHMPVDVRSASLAFLAFCAAIGLLRWTEEFVVPVLLGVVLSYALTPVVDRLATWRLSRMAGAAIVIGGLLSALVGSGFALRGQADEFLTALPQYVVKIRRAVVDGPSDEQGAMTRVQRAARSIEQSVSGAVPSDGQDATKVSPDASKPHVAKSPPVAGAVEVPYRQYLVTGTLGVFTFLGQALVVVFVALFLLAGGNSFRRKMLTLAGPKLSQRKLTLQALDEVHTQIQRYLLVQLATSLLVGLVTGIVFFLIGLDNAAIWGVVAGCTNLVPYVGAVATSVLAGVAGLVQFSMVDTAVLLAGASFLIHVVVGNLVTPWLTGRTAKMSPFVVFVAVLFFGWLWGVAGLVLAFPILVAVKIVCDRVEDLKGIGELLGA